LAGKLAFVTGGASGIGRAVAARFVAAGATVVIADIRDPSDSADAIGAYPVTLDVGDEAAVATVLAGIERDHGKLDILVNNAGILGREVPVAEQTMENFDLLLGVNLKSVHHGLRHAPRHMNDGGSIISTSSYNAFIALSDTPHYAVTKAGVNALTRNGAIDLGPRGIRVNAVCPGYVETALAGGDVVYRAAARACALGRAGKVEDLVGLYHFLAADESRYLTCQSIVIDGGWSAGVTPAAWEALSAS
jgi:3alpha(or 20beta)-hydroxysteroid dehydrogenase